MGKPMYLPVLTSESNLCNCRSSQSSALDNLTEKKRAITRAIRILIFQLVNVPTNVTDDAAILEEMCGILAMNY